MLTVKIRGLDEAQAGLLALGDALADLRPFWQRLGKDLADDAQARWPLRRRTGRLRTSLTWAGQKLARGGVYEASPDALRFGSAVFYGRFFQHGTKRHAALPLIQVDPDRHADQLASWLGERASAAGLEVQ